MANKYNKEHQIKQISIFNMAAMRLLADQKVDPAIILTNDWCAGFAAGYRHIGLFGDYFKVG